MFRLFGGSKKKEGGPPSPEGANSDHEEREAPEGFTELVPRATAGVPSGEGPPTYSSLQQQLPYQLPSHSQLPGVERRARESHPLAGVNFILSPRLTQDSELQYISTAVDSVLTKINSIEWTSLDYSFGLEQSVLDNQAALPSVEQMAIED